jgi:hypothetical protein
MSNDAQSKVFWKKGLLFYLRELGVLLFYYASRGGNYFPTFHDNLFITTTRCVKVWVHTCNLTAYRNTVSWQCGRDSWPRNLWRDGFAVRLRHFRCAVSVWPSHQRDDTVTAWSRLNMQRDTLSPSAPLAFFTFMMLLAPKTNWAPHGVTLAGYTVTPLGTRWKFRS